MIRMKNRRGRQTALRSIIRNRHVGSQAELLKALKEEGFTITQATLSRDLKRLGVVKMAADGGSYAYVLPSETQFRKVSTTPEMEALKGLAGVVSISFSENIGVLKTKPGHAGGIAYNIDQSPEGSIIGTIAGDDTILIVMAENASRSDVVNELIGILS